jgi:hypothetical protein
MEESFSEYWWRGKGHTLEFFTKFAQYLCCQPAERVLAHQPHQVNRIVATVCDEWDTKALTKSTSATADCKRSAGNQAPRDASIVSGKWHSPMPSRSRSRAQHYESDQHDLRNSVIDPKTQASFPLRDVRLLGWTGITIQEEFVANSASSIRNTNPQRR